MKQSSPRRGKPVVAFDSQVEGRENINAKISLLKLALQDDDKTEDLELAHLIRECFPRSPTAFNAWTSNKLPERAKPKVKAFRSNAPRTLKSNSDLQLSVGRLLGALNSRRRAAKGGSSKVESAAKLRRELNEAKMLKDIAMRELVDERNRRQEDASTYTSNLASANSAKDEAIRLLREAEEKIKKLQRELAVATQHPRGGSNVTPIRKEDGHA